MARESSERLVPLAACPRVLGQLKHWQQAASGTSGAPVWLAKACYDRYKRADYGRNRMQGMGLAGAKHAGLAVKFNLIDKIESLTAERIVASKQVSLAEEYLADHFPTFPVLPGVLMLEALTQAAAWLLHQRRSFACSMAVLREARNVKYGHFVAPGNALKIEVELSKLIDHGAIFKAAGSVGGAQALSARLELAYFNLADKQPELSEIDARLREHNRRRWNILNAVRNEITIEAAVQRS